MLIPGVDLLDHCPLVKVTWLWGQSDCSIIIDDPIELASKIWNNYGPKSNEECENYSISTFGGLTLLANFFFASNPWLWIFSLP